MNRPSRQWSVGDTIHGFANGCFGRDSYDCRVVEAVGPDWLVTRNSNQVAEFISKNDAADIDEPECPTSCDAGADLRRNKRRRHQLHDLS
jgi:hypothetical protein